MSRGTFVEQPLPRKLVQQHSSQKPDTCEWHERATRIPNVHAGLEALFLLQRQNSFGDVIAFDPQRGTYAPNARLAERSLDGPRLMGKYGDVVVIIKNGKNFQSIASLRNFRAHEESHMIAGIRQRDGNVLLAIIL